MKRLVVLTLVATALALPAHADASVSGCRTVDVAHVGRTVLGFVAYKFHQVKHWCWKYPRITYKQVYTYVSDMNKMKYRRLIASTGWFYRWCCGVSSSGHTSFRQAKLENCVPVIGCWHAEYPWVRISVHANGTYTARTGA